MHAGHSSFGPWDSKRNSAGGFLASTEKVKRNVVLLIHFNSFLTLRLTDFSSMFVLFCSKLGLSKLQSFCRLVAHSLRSALLFWGGQVMPGEGLVCVVGQVLHSMGLAQRRETKGLCEESSESRVLLGQGLDFFLHLRVTEVPKSINFFTQGAWRTRVMIPF